MSKQEPTTVRQRLPNGLKVEFRIQGSLKALKGRNGFNAGLLATPLALICFHHLGSILGPLNCVNLNQKSFEGFIDS